MWTDNAFSNITEFIDGAQEEKEETAKSYMRKLVDYTDILETMSEIGKKTNFSIAEYEIRQMIYKKHSRCSIYGYEKIPSKLVM